jgi:hypothetical protein
MGIDIDNTYALIIKWNMVRFVVALVVHNKCKLLHLHVKTFFLNNIMKQNIFMM